jgi:hypothetical protein
MIKIGMNKNPRMAATMPHRTAFIKHQESKHCFFEKKQQKTFYTLNGATWTAIAQRHRTSITKVFLVLGVPMTKRRSRVV